MPPDSPTKRSKEINAEMDLVQEERPSFQAFEARNDKD